MSSREMKETRLSGGRGEVNKPMAAGQWVAKAFANNKGKLHRTLEVAPGQKIPAAKLEKAEHSRNPTTRKEAQLAENAKHFNHSR